MDRTGWQSFIFLRPAACIWTPLGTLSGTMRPIRFDFPGCDFGTIFLRAAGCIWTPSDAILIALGPYFETRGHVFGSFFRAPGQAYALRSQ